ncbi:UPF0561 protein C2orf68 homolog isoform X2 [Zonotrichia leucophrys gambelii]|uniref:UPF0561 protein C2orf68 homolog isoform X2 n=1 Tax=Zonotrichia leucophrys gambelii TaxID=257770 RepID=UPI00314041C6
MRGGLSGKRRYRACALRRPLAAAAGPAGLLKAPRPGTEPAAGTVMEAAPATAAAPGWRCRPGGRLDMSHGFVRHIRRNQLARDAYDRAVRQARGRARTRLTPGPARPRRPDQQVYRPHRGGERGTGIPGGTGGDGCPTSRCTGRTGAAGPGAMPARVPPPRAAGPPRNRRGGRGSSASSTRGTTGG